MNSGSELGNRVLVIAYGNPLRCDDGIAWRVAEEIRRTGPEAAIRCVHQLTPELAEDASHASFVIFVDARRNGEPGEVRCHPVRADHISVKFSHTLEPAQVLAMCNQVYATEPRGFLVSIAGQSFDHGETLSSRVADALPQAVAMIRELSERQLLLQA